MGSYTRRSVWDFLDSDPTSGEFRKFHSYVTLGWIDSVVFSYDVRKWAKTVRYEKKKALERAARAWIPAIDPSEAAGILPRGLQVLAFDTDDLTRGFPYPAKLVNFYIPPEDWDYFLETIFSPLWNSEWNTVSKNIESILDKVAEQDVSIFRPKGLIMRVDMPGEQEFGLDFMDLYHSHHRGCRSNCHPRSTTKRRSHENPSCWRCGHIDNLSRAEASKVNHKRFVDPEKNEIVKTTEVGAMRFNLHASKHHLWRMRRKFYEGTRIVLDRLAVLDDPETAYKRGWTNWIKQCEEAKEKRPRDERKPRPSFSDIPAVLDYYEPFSQRKLSERIFRWPPSKQLYYDRWRGDAESKCGVWTPYKDSMEKRMKSHLRPRCVVPADGIAVMVLEKNGPEDRCLKTHKHMCSPQRIRGKKGPIYPGRSARRHRRVKHRRGLHHKRRSLSEWNHAAHKKRMKEWRQRTRIYNKAHQYDRRY